MKQKLIAAISTPQEAIALARIKTEYNIIKVIVFELKEFKSKKYTDLILSILRENFNYPVITVSIYELGLREANPIGSFFLLIYDYIVLRKLKKKCDYFIANEGGYLSGSFYNPLLSMYNCADRIIIVDHSPADARLRLSLNDSEKLDRMLKKTYTDFKGKTPRQIVFRIANIILLKVYESFAIFLFPLRKVLQTHDRAFVWAGSIRGTERLRYTELALHLLRDSVLRSSPCIKLGRKRTLFLFDHPVSYRQVPTLRNELMKVDLEYECAKMIDRHIEVGSEIIVKLHPFASALISEEVLKKLKANLEKNILELGHNKPFFFDEIILEKYQHYPVELFLDYLKVKNVLGTYSAVYLSSGDWPNIRYISDCSYIPSLAKMRTHDSKFFEQHFEMY